LSVITKVQKLKFGNSKKNVSIALAVSLLFAINLNCKQIPNDSMLPFQESNGELPADDPSENDDPGQPLLDSEELAAILEQARSSSVTKSISLAVITGDGAVYTAVANQEGDPYAVTSDMHFSIASCTKTFVAGCVFRLIEDGSLDLDDTLQTLLYDTGVLKDSFKENIDPRIRVRDLLNHTTGLDDFLGNLYYYDLLLNVYALWNPIMTLYYVDEPEYTYDAEHPENNECSYNNTDYILLGLIIERITRDDIYDVMTEYFLDPLKLSNTFMAGVFPYWGLTWVPGPNAIGFEPTGDTSTWEKTWIKSSTIVDIDAIALYSSTWTSGNMISDSVDMARWIRYYYRYQEELGYIVDDVFNEASELSDFFSERKFGYGIEYLKHESGTELWGHTGTIVGFNSMVFYMPEQDVSIAILINDHVIWRWGILHVVVDYVLGKLQ